MTENTVDIQPEVTTSGKTRLFVTKFVKTAVFVTGVAIVGAIVANVINQRNDTEEQ